MPVKSALHDPLAKLGLTGREPERGHDHHGGHESQKAPLGRRARAREGDPAHAHHEHEEGKR